MFKKQNAILNRIIGSFIGAFIGNTIYRYYDYINHPDLHQVQSAPWYISIQIQGLFTFAVIFTAIIFKMIIIKI